MKKVLFALLLGMATLAKAKDGFVTVPAVNLLDGNGYTRPAGSASITAGPWLASWLGGTALGLSPTTGVTFTASTSIPDDATKGDLAYIYATVSYDNITDSANLSTTAKMDITSILDSASNTTAANTATVYAAKVVPLAASSQLYDLEIGSFNAYPFQRVDLFFKRSAGASGVLYVHRVFIRYKRSNWF